MLLKKLKLKNIRSYINEEIIFPVEKTLLSGDIGSGKSTILLAIDFALFGIRRGELSGSALLRNGCDEGNVNLNFFIDKKDIFIKRTLKKTGNVIVQDSGYLTINDVTEELTPVELKQRILQILNYPPETLTKRSLIYRYTVYTPQEEMKLILLGEKEYRLETLRKVFNIDKYKRIKENSKIIISEIKLKKREFSTIIVDLEDRKLKLKEKQLEINKVNENIETNKVRSATLNELIIKRKQNISEFEDKINKFNELKKNLEIIFHTAKSKEETKNKNLSQLQNLDKQILELSKNIKELNYENIKQKIKENEDILEKLENEIRDNTKKVIELKNKKQNSDEVKNNIQKLDYCPLCKQNVSQEHKHEVIRREDENINKLQKDSELFTQKEIELYSKLKEINDIIKNFRNQEREYEINKIRIRELDNKKELTDTFKKDIEEIDLLIKQIEEKKKNIELELDEQKNLELEYKNTKKELEELLQQHKTVEVNLAVLQKESDTTNKEIIHMKNEIEFKEKAKEKLDYYIKLQDWFENFFVNITDIIEKKIMFKVHSDFNDLFQKWFSMLMDTDLIKVKLDEEFTPSIEQNGHDIEYENLSGGEKTACALAYRLALNQVINNIVSSVNTRDLIILDEPTDGFSSEQLDKVRLVLEELKMNQIIIVSHESKIESFVDNIIRIRKEGHVSKVIN